MAEAQKATRLNVRMSAEDDDLIRQAADALGQAVSEFVSSASVDRAREVLADQHRFVVDEDTWTEFVSALDQAAQQSPRLTALLANTRVDR